MNTQYDLIIIGAGPAGCAGAVYSARKQLKTLLILKEWGGQSIVSEDIQNWIGTPHISGVKLAESLKNHVLEYRGENVNIVERKYVKNITGTDGNFTVTLDDDTTHNSKTILVATGSSRRKLDIVGADIFEHKGVTYCASCDGPMFSGADVVVVGGGNAGFESASQLLAYCKSVTLLSRSEPRADSITIEKLKSKENFKLVTNAIPKSIQGNKFVESISYSLKDSKEEITIPCSAVFVEIGHVPATEFAKDLVKLNEVNKIVINPRTQDTGTKGVWAAGDCTDVLYNQNNIAVGDAVKAIEDIYLHLHA